MFLLLSIDLNSPLTIFRTYLTLYNKVTPLVIMQLLAIEAFQIH